MAKFILAHNKTLKNECLPGKYYTNDPDDAGGETYKGWAREKSPAWTGWVIIDSYKDRKDFPACLEKDDQLQKLVFAGYVRDYWNPIKGDEIKNQDVADQLYDTAVNTGVSRSLKLSQKSFGILETGHMTQELLNRLNALT